MNEYFPYSLYFVVIVCAVGVSSSLQRHKNSYKFCLVITKFWTEHNSEDSVMLEIVCDEWQLSKANEK